MTVFRANAVLRDRAGREVGSRYPLWSGDVAGAREASEAARAALGPHVGDQRVDAAVVTLTGADGSRVTFTEYAEDVRSGRNVSGNPTTALLDDETLPADQRAIIARQERERIEREALRAMSPVLEKAREQGWEVRDLLSPKGERKVVEKFSSGDSIFLDEAAHVDDATWKSGMDTLVSGSRELCWSFPTGRDVMQDIFDAKEQMERMGHGVDTMILGERAYDALVEQLRVKGRLPSGARAKHYTGPVMVAGIECHRSGADDNRVQTVRSPRALQHEAFKHPFNFVEGEYSNE